MTKDAAKLIQEIKRNVNKTNSNRFSTTDYIDFLNDAQKYIQMILFNAYPENNIFSTESVFDLVVEQYIYTLPADIYAISSINSVDVIGYPPMKKITAKERRTGVGYYVIGSEFRLAPVPQSSIVNGVSLIYTRKVIPLINLNDVSELPDVCENFLKLHVERRVSMVDSKKDNNRESMFTAKEEKALVELFADHCLDTKYPPITDSEAMDI
jgi:hypothetical protein